MHAMRHSGSEHLRNDSFRVIDTWEEKIVVGLKNGCARAGAMK